MRRAGYTVEIRNTEALQAIKAQFGVPAELQACHTARLGELIIEGHVPLAEIRKLRDMGGTAHGLAVPGMPVGAPGMEQGDRRDPYEVYLFGGEGAPTVFASY